MDAIQTPMSLYDPVYTEGGDTLYVMDQISDKKNREENWIEVLSLNEAVKKLTDGSGISSGFVFTRERPRWRWLRLIRISQAQVSRLEKSCSENAEKLPAIKSSESSQNLPDFFIV